LSPLPDIVQWPAGSLDFSRGALVMGILNVTPDSFSDGGLYDDADHAIEHGIEMAEQGAAIIDIGAESTRPGSVAVPAVEQIRRAVPVIAKLVSQIKIPVSIDTSDPLVAKAAIDAGASILNDITAFADASMPNVAVEKQVPVILMHMRGTPQTMQQNPVYDDVVEEVRAFLLQRAQQAQAAGIRPEHIILDPGIGFGKTVRHNLQLLQHLERICDTGHRVLVGTSRKGFIGKLTNREAKDRVFGTAATVALAIAKGASIVRVHDVAQMAEVVAVTNAILHPERFC
jgi:dihydropteroate synthase